MISGFAGGHVFKDGACECGRKLVDLRGITAADIGREGIAHVGRANAHEIEQIIALIAKMDAHFETILGWAKSHKE